MWIVIPALVSHLGAFQIRRPQQFFGMANPQIVEVIPESLANFLSEDRAEMVRTHVEMFRNLSHMDLWIGKVLVDVRPGLLDDQRTLVVRLVVSKNEGAGNDLFQFGSDFLESRDSLKDFFNLEDLWRKPAIFAAQIAHKLSGCQNDLQK